MVCIFSTPFLVAVFYFVERLVLQTICVLNKEILPFLGLKSRVHNQGYICESFMTLWIFFILKYYMFVYRPSISQKIQKYRIYNQIENLSVTWSTVLVALFGTFSVWIFNFGCVIQSHEWSSGTTLESTNQKRGHKQDRNQFCPIIIIPCW